MKHDWLNESLLAKVRFYARKLKLLKCNSIDMEDVEQELVYELLKTMEFFDPSRGNINAFAENVLLKRSKNYLRNNCTLKRGREVIFESVEHLEEMGKIIVDSCDDWDEKIMARIDFVKSINKLPIFQTHLCSLLQHHSIREVAKLLNVPYTSLHFEIQRMKRELEETSKNSQKRYRNDQYIHLKGNNMKNISVLETLTAKEISRLDTADLMDLNEQMSNLNIQVKEMKQKLEDGLNLRYSEAVKGNLRSEGKDTGTTRFFDGSHQIIADTPKKVTWDSEKMEEVVKQIPEERRRDLIKIIYAVDERRYLALPCEYQQLFKDARTITPGKTKFQIQRNAVPNN